MATSVEICNMALAKLGQRPISSLDDTSNQTARYCKTFYEQSKTAVLREYPWSFASINRELASVEVPEGYEKWGFAFGYPSDCLQARRLHDGIGNDYPYEVIIYRDGGGVDIKIIVTNLEVAYLNYSFNVNNNNLFDSQFVESFVLYLAKELAFPITKRSSVEKAMYERYLLSVPKAQNADAEEQSSIVSPENTWLEDRLS